MLTIKPGHSVDYYLREVATGRENYYTGAVTEGEPPGRWYGSGAEMLGLSGLVDHQDMKAVYEHFVDPRDPGFRDPSKWAEASKLGHGGRKYLTAEEIYQRSLDPEPNADAERREELRLDASKNERHNVAFYDVTFSVQKSITVLHAAFEAQEVKARKAGDHTAADAWAAHKQAVTDAIWAGNNAALDYLAEHAGFSRVGHHGGGAGRFIDAHGLTVASFLQHTSRENDPHLHIHDLILARVQGTDGVWRTLDGKSLYNHRPAAAGVAERTSLEHLARSLGVLATMRPDGKSREIRGIDQTVTQLLSSRRLAISPKAAELVASYEEKYGRAPNALQRDRLQRQAWDLTRPRKTHDGETLEQRLERWDAKLHAEIDTGLDQVASDVLALAGQEPAADTFDPDVVIETALADVQATKAAWTEADLARAINDALPEYLGGLDGGDVALLLHGLTRQAIEQHCVSLTAEAAGTDSLPDELRLTDGRSAYERPGARRYATTEHVRSERALRAAAIERTAVALPPYLAAGFLDGLGESGIELGADQAAAVRGVLTSGAGVESLVGPAGTGKSFVLATIAHAWQDPALWGGQQHKVVGLATTQIATMVLTAEGLQARNISQWLAVQQRLADGQPYGDDNAYRLNPGDLVVIDESAMTDTADIAAVHDVVAPADAKLLLTGDHKQLAAVGAAGGMDMIARVSPVYELTEARRFTHQWERDASLQLREGEQTALQTYRTHGRIVDGGTIEHTEQLAARAWLGDTLTGKHSLLVVDTNEQAGRLCAQIRTELVRLGRVEEHGVPLDLQGTIAGVGDVVQGRRNGWELARVAGNRRGPVNREQYRVLATRPDGGLVVAAITGRADGAEQLGERITLPATYVRADIALGYAATVHAAEGLTVDTTHTVAGSRTGASAFYVAMTRATAENTAYVITQAAPEDMPAGAANQITRQDPLAVLAGNFERDEPELAAIVQAEQNAAEAASLATIAERFTDAAEIATAGRTSTMLDRAVDHELLTTAQRAALAADDGTDSLARILRQAELAGHDPETVLRAAIASRPLGDARSLASVLHHRITETTDLHPAGDRYTDWTPRVDNPAWQQHLDQLAAAADTRRDQLGRDTAETSPAWAVEAFGPVPDDSAARAAWIERAGAVAAHRELTGHGDPDNVLPGAPKAGQVETYASYRAAWRALGRDEAARAEAEMSDGQLRMRLRAYQRELAWQPDYVAPELAGTIQASQRHHTTAALRTAEAANQTDPDRRAILERQAAEAQELAETLDQRAAELERADEIRARWYAHTAETRAAEQRARDELTARGINPDQPEQTTTAEHWLEAHHADQAAEDQHRPVTDEGDLADVVEQRNTDLAAAGPAVEAAETNVRDVREHADERRAEATAAEVDWTRVPGPGETADTIARAQRALAELQTRQAADQRRAAEEARAAQLAGWHHDDQLAARVSTRHDDRQLDRGA